MTFEKQRWQYHYAKPTSGRALWLLTPEEFGAANELLLKVVSASFYASNLKYFVSTDALSASSRGKLITSLRRQIRSIEIGLNNDLDVNHLVHTMNQDINALISDDGWRYVRKELNQRAKRSRKSHIEINNDWVVKIKGYMKSNGLGTYDEALENMFERLDELAEIKSQMSK